MNIGLSAKHVTVLTTKALKTRSNNRQRPSGRIKGLLLGCNSSVKEIPMKDMLPSRKEGFIFPFTKNLEKDDRWRTWSHGSSVSKKKQKEPVADYIAACTEAAGLKKTQCARVNTERQLCYTEVSEGDV